MSYCFKISILAKKCVIFIEKLQKSPSASGSTHTPLASGGKASRPPMALGSYRGSVPRPPSIPLPPIQKS